MESFDKKKKGAQKRYGATSCISPSVKYCLQLKHLYLQIARVLEQMRSRVRMSRLRLRSSTREELSSGTAPRNKAETQPSCIASTLVRTSPEFLTHIFTWYRNG
jgi:hypothetical protein